jgi:hypothetical protein
MKKKQGRRGVLAAYVFPFQKVDAASRRVYLAAPIIGTLESFAMHLA